MTTNPNTHKNNFDFLRLCFALFVLITHSYVLTGADNDFLGNLTNGQINFSGIGLKGFFTISGYLIFESVTRSRNWFDYMAKRVLRIYPALIVVLVLSFFLAMALSQEPVSQYLADRSAWSYIYRNLFLFGPIQYRIGNVFATNPLAYSINGSIWTIPYEFLFYILLSAFFILKKFPKLITAFLLVIAVGLYYMVRKVANLTEWYLPPSGYEVKSLVHFALYFTAGSILSSVNFGAFAFKRYVLFICLAISLILIFFQHFNHIQYILLPLMIISLGSLSTRGIAGLNKSLGDFSYGIYLYGFPVQQTLLHFFKLTPLQLMAACIPITFIFGVLSWFIIESKALKLKQLFSKSARKKKIAIT